MTQEIPLSWLRKGKLHPCPYHEDVLKILIRNKERMMTVAEIERKIHFVILQPFENGKHTSAVATILGDFYFDGIAREYEETRTYHNRQFKVKSWKLESAELPSNGYWNNSLRYENGELRKIKEPEKLPIKKTDLSANKARLRRRKIVIDNP